MENYERDDAFFRTVNRNREITDIAISASKEIEKQEMMYARRMAGANSAKKKYEEQRKKFEKARAIKTFAVAGAILATLATGLTVTVVHGEDIVNTNTAINIMTSNANIIIEAKGLSHGSFIEDNSVSDYKKLNVSSADEVYIYVYRSIISNSDEEVNDFIKSVSYYDAEGNKCYYTDFNDFLVRNNFKDEKDFKDSMRKFILKNYELGNVKELLYEGTGTVNRGRR